MMCVVISESVSKQWRILRDFSDQFPRIVSDGARQLSAEAEYRNTMDSESDSENPAARTGKERDRSKDQDNTTQELSNANQESIQEHDALLSGPRCGTRHTLALWAFLGFLNLYIQRVLMSIALVAMATQNATQPSVNVSAGECAGEDQPDLTTDTHVKAEFQWSNTLQGFVLSAFYYGYFVTQIPSSFLASFLGGKLMFVLAVGGCSGLTLLTPLSARLHPGVLIANRVLQGLLQGVVFPSMQMMLSKWVPARERSFMVSFTYAGCQAGTVVGLLGGGYICDSSPGWPVAFYVAGGLGFLWCVGWMVFTFDSPTLHPRISDEEKYYILRSVDNHQLKTPSIPWKSIATSPAMYAIAAAHFANDWGCFAVMTCLPKFMKDVLNYDLSSNGLLSSLPYWVMWASNLVAGALADCLRKPNRLKTATVRKIMVSIGLVGPASLLLASAYYPGCERVVLVVLLTLATGLSGFTMAGHSVNHLDIAPVFAGLLFAMTNTFGTSSGWVGPALAGALTEHTQDMRAGWQTFFLVSGAMYATGGTLFVLFARGEVQPWAKVGVDRQFLIPPPSYGSTQTQDDHMTGEGAE